MEEIHEGFGLVSSGKRMVPRVSQGRSGKRLIFEGCFWETTRNGAMEERSGKD